LRALIQGAILLAMSNDPALGRHGRIAELHLATERVKLRCPGQAPLSGPSRTCPAAA
jgi:hypothetical protein